MRSACHILCRGDAGNPVRYAGAGRNPGEVAVALRQAVQWGLDAGLRRCDE